MADENEDDAREKVLFRYIVIACLCTGAVLEILSEWHPIFDRIINAYAWTLVVFGYVLVDRRNMLRKLLFWVIFLPFLTLHLAFMWEARSGISHANLWLLFVPMIVEALIVNGVIEYLKSRIERS